MSRAVLLCCILACSTSGVAASPNNNAEKLLQDRVRASQVRAAKYLSTLIDTRRRFSPWGLGGRRSTAGLCAIALLTIDAPSARALARVAYRVGFSAGRSGNTPPCLYGLGAVAPIVSATEGPRVHREVVAHITHFFRGALWTDRSDAPRVEQASLTTSFFAMRGLRDFTNEGMRDAVLRGRPVMALDHVRNHVRHLVATQLPNGTWPAFRRLRSTQCIEAIAFEGYFNLVVAKEVLQRNGRKMKVPGYSRAVTRAGWAVRREAKRVLASLREKELPFRTGGPWAYYTLWAMRSALRELGRPRVGRRNWRHEVAACLVRAQDKEGAWSAGIRDEPRASPIATAFALLALGDPTGLDLQKK